MSTKDTRVKCATCGLTYDPKGKAPLPACGSEDGPTGPKGFRPEERQFMRCVLSVNEPKPESSEILRVFGAAGKWWLILSCGHWVKWSGGKPRVGDPFPCPACRTVRTDSEHRQ